MKERREDWQECMPGLDLERLFFLDECGINTLMSRARGRCPGGAAAGRLLAGREVAKPPRCCRR